MVHDWGPSLRKTNIVIYTPIFIYLSEQDHAFTGTSANRTQSNEAAGRTVAGTGHT